jgi:hypothetical protein
MAYQTANPRSFMPHGFPALNIQHCEIMARAVTWSHPQTHEDYAIISIDPLPGNVLNFGAVHEVVHEFLDEHMEVRVRDIQLSHLGQVLVRFSHVHDRDALVINSPHAYGGVHFRVVRPNHARNWRAMNFNRECWLVLMGLPLDYWDNETI